MLSDRGCAGLFRGSRGHERKEKVALQLGLEGWIEPPPHVASLAAVLLLGWTLWLSGPGWREEV